ncbi:MAG: 16S rRNA (cytosine(967)-C(5))-methyltransferase RsmB [Lachnospiraceae bacterium]
MSESVNLRAIVLDILVEVNEKNGYSHVVQNNALRKFQYLDKSERGFISRLAEGTLEKQIYVDYVIDSFSKVKVKKMKPLIRNLMRMSVYQILFMDGVPDSAACNEAVKLVQQRNFGTLKGFVNGVLRNIARNKDHLEEPKELSVRYSMPEWIIDQWKEQYDEKTLKTMLESFEEERPTYVRYNTLLKPEQDITRSLGDQGVTVEAVWGIPHAYKISGYDYLESLQAFRQGFINVQDISSMLVALVANPKKGDTVLDVCAAPGGKSMHVAMMMSGTGCVEARDLSENKVWMMQDTVERMGLSNVKTAVKDARKLYDEDVERGDIVLADLPCSGLGIIGRKADIKYKMTYEKEKELAALQREILATVAQYVKKGGRLVYSTCTIDFMENEENYEWIKEHLGLVPVNIKDYIPEWIRKDNETAERGFIQLLPGIHGTDGFFISCFEKVGNPNG